MAKAKELHAPDFVDAGAANEIDFETAHINTLQGAVIVPGAEAAEREWGKANDMAAAEKFMQDKLTLEVHTSTDPNAPPLAPVGVNGRLVWFVRGMRYKNVPRCYVEILARSQSRRFQKSEQVRDPSADVQMRTMSRQAHDYPFSVSHDPAGARGQQWLERVIREGC